MPPINLEYSVKENDLGTELNLYTRRKGGIAFNSQAGFTLPSGAVRCPDAAWLSAAKWEALPPAERLRFGRVVPEFVIEVRSPSEDVAQQLTKMEEWREAGVQLGWLLCPESERAWVFRAAPTPPQLYTGFDRELSGEDILPGFVLDLRLIKG